MDTCDLTSVPLFCPRDSLCLQRFEPSLGLLTPVSPMMAGISLVPPPPAPPEVPVVKEIIHCKSCTLFPQNPSKILHEPVEGLCSHEKLMSHFSLQCWSDRSRVS